MGLARVCTNPHAPPPPPLQSTPRPLTPESSMKWDATPQEWRDEAAAYLAEVGTRF